MHPDVAAAGAQQAQQQADGGLPGPVRPEQRHGLPGRHVQVKAHQGDYGAVGLWPA